MQGNMASEVLKGPLTLPGELQMMVLREVATLEGLEKPSDWQNIKNCLLVCHNWRSALRRLLVFHSPIDKLICVCEWEDILVEALQKAIDRFWLYECDDSVDLTGKCRLGDLLVEVTKRGFVRCIKILLDSGADLSVKTDLDVSLAHLAVMSGRVEALNYVAGRFMYLLEDVPGSTNSSPLGLAIKEERADMVHALFRLGADPNTLVATPDLPARSYQLDDWLKPIPYVALNGSLSMMEVLLDWIGRSYIVRERGRRGMPTSLVSAIMRDRKEMIAFLLKSGAPANVRSFERWVPLTEAIRRQCATEVVSMLLDAGARPEIPDKGGIIPLLACVLEDVPQYVPLLVAAGADVNAVCSNEDQKMPSLCHAAIKGNSDIVESLLYNGADLNLTDANGNTALHLGAINRRHEVVKLLLEHGAIADVPNTNNETPLQQAVLSGCLQTVNHLLEYGANLSLAMEDGRTPLTYSIMKGHADIAKLLIERGANTMKVDVKGRTPLHCLIAREGSLELGKILIDKSPSLNMRDYTGKTPIMQAASQGCHHLVKLLLDSGADVDLPNTHQRTPLVAAIRGGRSDIARLLLESGANPHLTTENGETPLMNAARYNDADVTEILLAYGVDMEARSSEGWTALHYSASSRLQLGSSKSASVLLKHGANPNATTSGGITPLILASGAGHYLTVAVLLKSGANASIGANSVKTALHVSSIHGHFEITKLLLNSGANVNILCGLLRTPIDCAAAREHIAIVKLLRSRGSCEPKTW